MHVYISKNMFINAALGICLLIKLTRCDAFRKVKGIKALVDECKQVARISICGRQCKFCSHIYFDHRAKTGCCFSYCVRTCRRCQFFFLGGDAGAPPP